MDFFYDGQIRRYITQFMRVFIGFKYQDGDNEQHYVPVMYGDLTRQVAQIIKENSENKMPTVPRIACYMTGLELDTSRLSDATFVSKLHLRQRDYTTDPTTGSPTYAETQGGAYTVERLMPTPFKLTMKADIWTSNTDQKLQLMEQILVLFNPSLEIQTTDNYIDWSSLSVIDLGNINLSSRSIPVGSETEIDIASLEFSMPIYINPPAKVKKLGVIKSIIANVFTDTGDVKSLNQLVYNQAEGNVQVRVTIDQNTVVLLKSPNPIDNEYHLTFENNPSADWKTVLDMYGGYSATSLIHFDQPLGFSITGTFEINELDPKTLIVLLDTDTIPSNTTAPIDRIVDPYNFNPITFYNGNIPIGTRLLVLDNINDPNVARVGADDAWVNLDSAYAIIKANSIIEWDGTYWRVDFDPDLNDSSTLYVTNLTSKVQYRWDGTQWLRSFEGEYAPGYWRLELD